MRVFLQSVCAVLLLSSARAAWAEAPATPQSGRFASQDERRTFEAWRKSMARVPLPKRGCFKVTYPARTWQEVPCAKPPNRLYGPGPQVVGNGVDFSAQVTGLISSAVGSFDSVNVTGENENGVANSYSLQLNTQLFNTAKCSSSLNQPCQGWQQFVYSTTCEDSTACTSTNSSAFIQYWLIGYFGFPESCPTGWLNAVGGCAMNSVNAVVLPAQSIANLIDMSLTGTASTTGGDTLIIATSDGTLSALNEDSVLNLAKHWQQAEFGIFGDGGGSAATFTPDPGATMAVRTSVDNGTTSSPTCVMQGFTGETNSLSLVPPCCPYGGTSPAIVFWLSNNPAATSECVGRTSIGDTHLTNFNRLLYDFQASGDFLLAATNPGFVVQTRQKSGAPKWPNASVNKAVAMALGKTRAAVCLEPTRVIIDGRKRALADEKTTTLPGGVRVARSGDVYLFTRPSGESVRTEVHPGWIDVAVDLGRLPAARVYGLLGNANGDMAEHDLARRDGTVLTQPISFDDLYHAYADSWRVSPGDSLLTSQCGESNSESGIPERPFYAQHLDAKDYERARTLCTQAGVRDPSLLDACTLDTVVLGTEAAAKAFVRAHPPRGEVRPGSGHRD